MKNLRPDVGFHDQMLYPTEESSIANGDHLILLHDLHHQNGPG